MKTAMQELIEKIEKLYLIKQNENSYELFRQLELEALEKEKEQIISAYNDGVNDGKTQGLKGKEGNGNYETLEQYYNQTYNQNK